MTIYEIKRRTHETAPYFFSRETMKFFGQTLKDFNVREMNDGRYRISAPIRDDERIVGYTIAIFDPKTNELIDESKIGKEA